MYACTHSLRMSPTIVSFLSTLRFGVRHVHLGVRHLRGLVRAVNIGQHAVIPRGSGLIELLLDVGEPVVQLTHSTAKRNTVLKQ